MVDSQIDEDASGDSTETTEGDVYTDPKESGLRLGTGGGILYELLIESRQ